MIRYALLGKSLSHSFSEQYLSEKFFKEGIKNTEYINLELDNLNKLKDKIKELNLSGFNVTIPYKIEIISKLDFISNQAKTINAVNTVKVIEGKLHGFNTDIIGFTKSVAHELGSRNIRCNAIAPGFIETDMTHYLQDGDASAEFLKKIPLGRFGKAEEIANTTLILASDLSSYITGQVLSACGGLNI